MSTATPPAGTHPGSQAADLSATRTEDIITLGGGCFWCTEAVFLKVKGVLSVESGYTNGQVQHPNYEQVCSGQTGHSEVVRVRFNPSVVSLTELLQVFFAVHDPTTLNRQGADVGTQYRSGIYYHRPDQLGEIRQVLDEANAAHGGKVVTEVQPEQNYWPAEAYHQRYFENHPEQGYCAFVVAPKVDKFLKKFRELVRTDSA
ncbi:peptide-methionine (S)-S-oxide reductase MsrA [Roseateles terrae]|uniref:Peptide methionine sulfoxide reductase MsrA n=1 Tax=Roseateles terrae TaxID=431060 RepID=A0ABR6GLL7_9BURK|nr:peptide-methionine (S)-S-oxide reductase MsrA [Roseateles terrae]MBB3193010.1 peptide-methionine (S)-S-oxide reductase [Roseateles terrae]OWQ89747.1 peptide-methionine (S)-S-oxide reductase [Roseateles terrae]